jgi:phage/plasmid-associated DNA primase
VSIPIEERDAGLKDALLKELPGILAWAVAGCLLWLERGMGTPAEVQLATEQYRRDSDTLGAFLDECCVVDVGNVDVAAPASLLYGAYKRWADQGGEFQLSQTAFGRRLEERGITSDKRGRGTDRTKWRIGVRVVESVMDLLPGGSRLPHSSTGNGATHGGNGRYEETGNGFL